MPMVEALRRCPQAIVVPVRHARYAEVSAQVFAIFRRFTPLVEGLSLDEAFLDVTASRALFGDGEAIAAQIKRAIRDETGLTASAGVSRPASSPRRSRAICGSPTASSSSPATSPPSSRRCRSSACGAWARARPSGSTRRGSRPSAISRAAPAPRLHELLGPAWGEHVRLLAAGVDERAVVPGRAAESIGAEETVEEDLRGREPIERWLLDLSGRVARRLLKAGLSCRAVVVKLKYSDFTLRTRQTRLSEPVSDTDSIHTCAKGAARRFDLSAAGAARRRRRRRPDEPDRRPDAEPVPGRLPSAAGRPRGVVAEVAERFGGKGLTRAALLGKKKRIQDELPARAARTSRGPGRARDSEKKTVCGPVGPRGR